MSFSVTAVLVRPKNHILTFLISLVFSLKSHVVIIFIIYVVVFYFILLSDLDVYHLEYECLSTGI